MLQLEFENPELARNVDDPVKFEQVAVWVLNSPFIIYERMPLQKLLYLCQVLRNQQKARDESAQRQQKILRADPMDIEAQRLIEEVFYANLFNLLSYHQPQRFMFMNLRIRSF